MLTTPPQSMQPSPSNIPSEGTQASVVARHGVIVEVALNHAPQPLADHRDRLVLSAVQRLSQRLETGAHSLRNGQSLLGTLTHQERSKPLMKGLHDWMTEQFEQHLVEPNSGLGGALRYLIKHWEPLTLFLRQAGAPLDNNVCERALKRAILHRKGSMFYKTPNGAEVGDVYMSVIHTCRLCDVNPFDDLQALQKNAPAVTARPTEWLPWNYRGQLAPVS